MGGMRCLAFITLSSFCCAGSAHRNGSGTDGRQSQEERNVNASKQIEATRISALDISKIKSFNSSNAG